MRKILIIGAGQAGLLLALGLQAEGYDVTVMSARTADEIRGGWPTSTQFMFEPALAWERQYRLNLWDDQAPHVRGMGVSLAPAPGTRGRPRLPAISPAVSGMKVLIVPVNPAGRLLWHSVWGATRRPASPSRLCYRGRRARSPARKGSGSPTGHCRSNQMCPP